MSLPAPPTTLTALGWGGAFQAALEQLRLQRQDPALEPARVCAEHRGAYELWTEQGPRWAESTGRLRHTARDRLGLPAVGDWVALGSDGRIAEVLPRHSAFLRKAAGSRSAPQLIAANIDRVFIVTSANADFNPRRIERYVAAVRESGATPTLVLNKTDLCADVDALLATLGEAARDLPLVCVSALLQSGVEGLRAQLGAGLSIALVGSSGVGKSTLVNWLLARAAQATGEIRAYDERGRHTTTRRELLPLPGGGALIDTPGMREFGLWSESADLAGTFADIDALMQACRFSDCQHRAEPGCAISAALGSGELDPTRLESFYKLQRELAHQNAETRRASQAQREQSGKRHTRALRQRKRGPEGGKLR